MIALEKKRVRETWYIGMMRAGCRMVRCSLTEKVTCEKRLEGSEKMSHVGVQWKSKGEQRKS